MSGNRQPGERPGPPNAFVVMVLVSLVIHVALVGAVVVLAAPRFDASADEHFAISLQHPPIDFNSLPPLEGNREAGPAVVAPEDVIAEPEIEEAELEEPEPEPAKPEPEPEAKKPEPVREEPKQAEERSEPEVVSTRASKKPVEPEPEPEPEETARQLRERLESSQGVYSTGGAEASHHVAVDGMAGDASGGGAPDLFRNRLVALIGASWNAPRLPPGQVMEAVVEFTIYSPPVDEDAVNQNRSRARVESVVLVSSSGDERFDASALETIRRLRNLPPLPGYIKEERLRVSCRFYFIGE